MTSSSSSSSSQEPLSLGRTAVASSLAALTARAVCHPIDTVKARLQAFGSASRFGASLSDVVHRVVASEGIRGLYRGFGSVAVVGTPGGMIYLTTYEQLKQLRPLSSSFAWHFACGIGAEAAACVVFVPVDVVKERCQVDAATDSWRCATELVARDGIGALYKGYAATMLSFGAYAGLYFALYEVAKSSLQTRKQRPDHDNEPPTFAASLLAASLAATAASFLTAPLDLAKLRLQTLDSENPAWRRGNLLLNRLTRLGPFAHILVTAARTEGLQGLFRGAGARVAFFAPSTAISMATFEALKHRLATSS